MSKFDQAKMLMRVKKIQKELQKQVIEIEQGDGAVRVEITGEQKIKKIHIDPEYVDLDDIGQVFFKYLRGISTVVILYAAAQTIWGELVKSAPNFAPAPANLAILDAQLKRRTPGVSPAFRAASARASE